MSAEMTEFGIKSKVLDDIKALAQHYGVRRVVLFGSRARGDYKQRSDIDLAFSGGDRLRFPLAVDEETSTLLMYDIVDLDKPIDEELRSSIECEGKVLYEEV